MKIANLLKTFLRSDFGIALLITVAWKVLLTTLGFVIDSVNGGATSLIDHTMRWDAGWYVTILNGHYADNLASAAFYPLFPLFVGTVHVLSFGLFDYAVSGQILNTVAVWFGLTALIKLGRQLVGENNKFWLVALLLSAPAAFFMHVFYSEALFIALSFWAYYFALKRRWFGVGILLALLTATRLPSVLIVALCGLEFMRAYDWNIKKIFNKNLLLFLLVPFGFIAFSVYLHFTQNDFLGMFHAYQATTDWVYQVFNPNIIETIAKSAYQIVRAIAGLRPFDNELFINIALPLWSLFILGISSLYLILKHRKNLLPLGITGLLAIIMFTLNSNIVSAHRYVLPMLAVYIATVLFVGKFKLRTWILVLICSIGVIIQLSLFMFFIRTLFAG